MGARKGYNASRCALELLEATGHGERVTAMDAKVVIAPQAPRRSMVADAEWVTRDELDARLQEKDAQLAAVDARLQEKDAQLAAVDARLQEKGAQFAALRTEMTSFREEMIALATGQAVAITKLKAASAQYQEFVTDVVGLI